MTEVALSKCEISADGPQVLSTARNEWNRNRSHIEKERKKIIISEAKLETKKSNKWYEWLFLINLIWFLQSEKLGARE